MTYRLLVTNAGDGTVAGFDLDGRRLRRRAVTQVGDGCSTLAIDPGRSLVHVAVKTADPAVVTCERGEDGSLRPRHRASTGESMTYLALSPDGRFLAGASYGGGFGLVWPVGQGGRLGEPTARVEYPNLHAVAFSPDNGFVYFVSLGADLVAGYALADDGSLTALPTTPAPAGSGPRHLVLTSSGERLYVLTEFSGQVLSFDRDRTSGRLHATGTAAAYAKDRGLRHSVLGADPRAHHYVWGADLVLTRDERFLVCSERCESTLAVLPLAVDGTANPVTQLVQTQQQPRGIAVSPDGRYVVATGERSTSITAYEVDAGTGRLRELDTAETGAGANWVRFC